MKKYIICNTHELYCDDIEFTCKDNEDPELVAESVLEENGYSEFCDNNGFITYDFDLVEVEDEEI